MSDLINCPDCNKEISPRATACPHCGAPNETAETGSTPVSTENQNTALLCNECNIALIRKDEKSSVTGAGILGALLFIIGIPFLFFIPVLGIILMIVGILAGIMSKRTQTYMVCPQCGYKRDIPG